MKTTVDRGAWFTGAVIVLVAFATAVLTLAVMPENDVVRFIGFYGPLIVWTVILLPLAFLHALVNGRWLWMLVIFFGSVFGGTLYWLWHRPTRERSPGWSPPESAHPSRERLVP